MSLFQSNLRKQIRNLPKILKSVKMIHYYSLLFICVLRPRIGRLPRGRASSAAYSCSLRRRLAISRPRARSLPVSQSVRSRRRITRRRLDMLLREEVVQRTKRRERTSTSAQNDERCTGKLIAATTKKGLSMGSALLVAR